MNAKRLWLLVTGLLIVALMSSSIASTAGAGSDSDPKPAPAKQGGELPDSTLIRLAAGSFDPLQSVPELPQELAYSEAQAAAAETYIVQFNGPVLPEWKDALTSAGAELGDYLPENAFLVHLTGAVKAEVQSLPFVRWVGAYQPGYKLAADVDYAGTRSYRVILAPWAETSKVEASLQAMGAPARAFGQGISAVLSGSQINAVAQLPDVVWIEPYHLQKLYNDVAAATIMGGTTAWSNGYTGSGVTVAVGDTGLDNGNPANIHQDFNGRVAQIYSWPVVSVDYGGGCATANAGADDGPADVESGHGTHVTGSVAGNGARSGGAFKGLAYEASIVFQAVEQNTIWQFPNPINCPNGYYLTGIPDDVRTLLQQAYSAGARVHNDSWGGGQFGDYDQQSAWFDDFIASHPEMAVVVAAGNAGRDANADGYVDQNSVSSPATAKNVITIGASDNERASGGIATYSWFMAWPSNFPTNPTRDDLTSDSRQELAAFSSRGPLEDGRIKPDLVAPGTNIVSVRSSQASETGWGVYNTYYMYMGGTSMASPLTAGAAAVVRDYYITSEGVSNPSAALIKATLINSAVDITGYGNAGQEAGQPIPNNHEGWGLVNVGAATTPGSREFVDNTTGVNASATLTYAYTVAAGKPFKVSLVWSDKAGNPAAGSALVNNLNLRVTSPSNAVYQGNVFNGGWSQTGGSADTKNNVENVYIQSPAAGNWTVEVIGAGVPQGPQPFALVVDGNLSPSSTLNVTSINPYKGPNTGPINNVVISGSGFEASSAVQLVNGASTINGTSVVVNTGQGTITANFNLTGATTGFWDVKVINTGASVTRSKAFWVYNPSALVFLRLPYTAKQRVVQQQQTDPFQNPNFESGRNVGWTENSTGGYDIVVNSGMPIPPRSGSWIAWLGGAYDEVSTITQQVSLPGSPNTLSFYYWIGSAETSCGSDIARVYIGGSIVWQKNLCSNENTNAWVEGTANLSAYAGQSVSVQFYAQTNSTLNSNFFVDDVSLK